MVKKSYVALGVLTLCGFVFAQGTPDGETPANEGVCDELMGATPGLYGLCIAYCEAQDLDGVVGDNTDTIEKKVPKTKILENYIRKMGPGDPEMPCIQAPVPCWTQEEIDAVGSNGGNVRIYRHIGVDSTCFETWYLEERGPFPDGTSTWGLYAGARYDTSKQEWRCWHINQLADPPIARFLAITPEEYDAAEQSIIDRATVLGWNVWASPGPPCP